MALAREKGGGGMLPGLIFAGYVPLASQNPYPIIVYYVAKYRPHLSHFGKMYFSPSQLSKFLFMHLLYKALKLGHPEMN